MKKVLLILSWIPVLCASAETTLRLPWKSESGGESRQPAVAAPSGRSADLAGGSEEDIFRSLAADFLVSCQAGKWEQAYALMDADYRRSVTQDQFQGFLNRWPIFSNHGSKEFRSVRNHRGVGLVDLELRGTQTANAEFQLRDDDGRWAISVFGICGGDFGIFVPGGQSPAAKFGNNSGSPSPMANTSKQGNTASYLASPGQDDQHPQRRARLMSGDWWPRGRV